jgi:hypothetical protein
MSFSLSNVTTDKYEKIVKALYYSFGSGFVGGFLLAFTGAMSNEVKGGNIAIGKSFVVALIVGGVVAGLNSLAVTIRQMWSK